MVGDENVPGESAPGVSEVERSALVTIAHGAVVTSGGVSIRHALSVWVEAVLTRGLRSELYGVYAFGWRVMKMALRFANMGSHVTLLRDMPALDDQPDRQRRVLGLAYATTAATAPAIALGLFLGAPWFNAVTIEHPTFPAVLRLFAVVLVLSAFVRLYASWFKGAMSANGEALLTKVLQPGARLLAVSVALALGYSVVGVVGALAVGFAILAVTAYPAASAVTGIRPTYRGLRSEARHFYDHAIPTAVGNVGSLLRGRVDVLLIGFFLTATAAGVYNVVLVLVGVARIPLSAFNQLFPAVASDLYSGDEMAALNNVYTTVTRLIVTATVPIVAVMLVYGDQLLGVFGPAYVRGYPLLVVFLVGRFVGNMVGSTGFLMSMTNHQYTLMVLEWLLAVLNVTLTYLFVVKFGLIGAALGTSAAITIQNTIQLALLYRSEGLWPLDATFLKPLGAGLGMTGMMAAVRAASDSALAVGTGVAGGLLAFIAVLIVLGVEERDRLIVEELASQYRSAVDDSLSRVL